MDFNLSCPGPGQYDNTINITSPQEETVPVLCADEAEEWLTAGMDPVLLAREKEKRPPPSLGDCGPSNFTSPPVLLAAMSTRSKMNKMVLLQNNPELYCHPTLYFCTSVLGFRSVQLHSTYLRFTSESHTSFTV